MLIRLLTPANFLFNKEILREMTVAAVRGKILPWKIKWIYHQVQGKLQKARIPEPQAGFPVLTWVC